MITPCPCPHGQNGLIALAHVMPFANSETTLTLTSIAELRSMSDVLSRLRSTPIRGCKKCFGPIWGERSKWRLTSISWFYSITHSLSKTRRQQLSFIASTTNNKPGCVNPPPVIINSGVKLLQATNVSIGGVWLVRRIGTGIRPEYSLQCGHSGWIISMIAHERQCL